MAGKGMRLRWQPTTTSGSVTQSMTAWSSIVNGSAVLEHVFLRASNGDSTKFDFKITSPTGNVIYIRKDIVGELNEEARLLMRGLYSLTIENCSPNDTFELECMFRDINYK